MLRASIKIAAWLGATLIVAIAGIAVGNDSTSGADSAGAIAQACAGAAPTRQLDNVLFNARALSDGGADPICAPPADESDDDFDGVMLSHSHGAHGESNPFGFFGDEPRRR